MVTGEICSVAAEASAQHPHASAPAAARVACVPKKAGMPTAVQK
jgi:hypothetical protein